MRYFLTQGIILKKQDWKDNDSLITIFSPEFGKFKAISKGARKMNSSFIGHLEILNICNFQIYKTSHHYTITQCQLTKSHFKIRNNLEKTLFSLIIIEIFQKSIGQEVPAEELFELVIESLEEITEENDYHFILEKFKIKLLQFLGSLPEMDHCFFCRKRWEINEKICLDEYGHLACNKCLNDKQFTENFLSSSIAHKKFEPIAFNLIKLIHYLSKNDFKQALRIALNTEEKFQLRRVTNTFLYNYLHQEIHSEKMINKISRVS